MTLLAQASHGHSRGVKADTHLRPLEKKQHRQKLRELVGLAPRCLGAEKVCMGPAAEGQQVCSLSRESQLYWQEHGATDSDRQANVSPNTVTYQLWNQAFLSLTFPFYKFERIISTLQGYSENEKAFVCKT